MHFYELVAELYDPTHVFYFFRNTKSSFCSVFFIEALIQTSLVLAKTVFLRAQIGDTITLHKIGGFSNYNNSCRCITEHRIYAH